VFSRSSRLLQERDLLVGETVVEPDRDRVRHLPQDHEVRRVVVRCLLRIEDEHAQRATAHDERQEAARLDPEVREHPP
jgi:hypothetical protein